MTRSGAGAGQVLCGAGAVNAISDILYKPHAAMVIILTIYRAREQVGKINIILQL